MSKRQNVKKTKCQKDKMSKRPKREFHIVMSGQFCTLAMFNEVRGADQVFLALAISLRQIEQTSLCARSSDADTVGNLQRIDKTLRCTFSKKYKTLITKETWVTSSLTIPISLVCQGKSCQCLLPLNRTRSHKMLLKVCAPWGRSKRWSKEGHFSLCSRTMSARSSRRPMPRRRSGNKII